MRLVRRSVVDQGGALLALAVLVMVTTLAAVGVPRLVTGLLDDDLSRTVASASPAYRDPVAGVSLAPDASVTDPDDFFRQVWQALPDRLRTAHANMRPGLRAVLDDGHVAARAAGVSSGGLPAGGLRDFPASGLPDGLPIATGYRIDAFSGLRDESRLVAGHWPTPATGIASAVEVVATPRTAREMRWRVGEEQQLAQAGDPVTVRLVGLVSPKAGGSDFWALDPGRSRTSVTYSSDQTPTRHGIVFVDASTWPELGPQLGGFDVSAWYRLDPSAISTASLPGITAGFDRLLADPPAVTTANGDARVLRFGSFLPRLVDLADQRASASGQLLAVSAAGPLGAALLVVVLATSVVVARRRSDRALLRARGAGTRATVLRSVLETGLATVPGALLGWLAAVLLLPDASSSTGIAAAVIGLVLPPGVTAVVALAEALHDRGARIAPFRWVFETLVVAGAAAAVAAVLRNVRSAAPDGTPVGATPPAGDPLVVVAPLLVAATVVVVLLRVRPTVVRWSSRLVRDRSAAAFLGTAEDARGGAAPAWVLGAVVLATGTGVLAAVLLDALRSATARTSGDTTGLDTSVLVAGSAAVVVGGLVLAALLTAAAVVITVVAAAPERRRHGALLRTFGLSGRERTAVTVWELVPRCVLGVVGGTVAGLVSAVIVAPAIVPGTARVAPDPLTIVLTAVAFGLAATAATVVAVLSDRRRSALVDDRSAP
ncbi:FtsX-like permease family protein [Curtobacterium sp. SP.BCo]|uniref:FtsX-like permease family protein n=1 Tax=Curtobacterium sp. SP.BCo TaxID=3435229 RepID=UPI003F732BA1